MIVSMTTPDQAVLDNVIGKLNPLKWAIGSYTLFDTLSLRGALKIYIGSVY